MTSYDEDDALTELTLRDDGLAYKDMKDSYYYAISISFFIVIIFGSIFIPTVDTIF